MTNKMIVFNRIRSENITLNRLHQYMINRSYEVRNPPQPDASSKYLIQWLNSIFFLGIISY